MIRSKLRQLAIPNWIIDDSKSDSNHFDWIHLSRVKIWQWNWIPIKVRFRLKFNFDFSPILIKVWFLLILTNFYVFWPIFDQIRLIKSQLKDPKNVKTHQKWLKSIKNGWSQSKITKSIAKETKFLIKWPNFKR